MYEVELYHHGVKGQKWGVRHFQSKDGSYKLGAEGRYDGGGIIKKVSGSIKGVKSGLSVRRKNHALSSENKKLAAQNKKLAAQNKKLSDKSKKEKEEKKFELSDRQKKALKIGAAVAGTALAAYGAKKLYDHVDASHKGKLIAKKLLEDAGGDFEKASAAWVDRRSELNRLKGAGSLGKYGPKQDKILEATRKSISDRYVKNMNSATLLSKDLQAAKEVSRANHKEQFAKATKGIRNAAEAVGNKAKAGASEARSKSKEVAKNARTAYERNAGKRMANAINRDYALRQAMNKARDTVKSASSRARTTAGKAATAARSGASKAQEYVYNKSMERTRNGYAKRVARDLRRRGRL